MNNTHTRLEDVQIKSRSNRQFRQSHIATVKESSWKITAVFRYDSLEYEILPNAGSCNSLENRFEIISCTQLKHYPKQIARYISLAAHWPRATVKMPPPCGRRAHTKCAKNPVRSSVAAFCG